jgi:large subunit ribosomal protein L31
MKTGVHPEYTHQAVVTCTTCGTTFTTGSTLTDLKVEVCSHCHPFFTGKQNIIDTAGRVDRYKKLSAKRASGSQPIRSRRAKLDAKKARKVAKATPEK